MRADFLRKGAAMAGLRAFAAGWLAVAAAAQGGEPGGRVLARIDIRNPGEPFSMPVHAQLQDSAGGHYVLVKATAEELERLEGEPRILDADIESAVYILAREFRPGARAAARGFFPIVHDDGRRLIIRSAAGAEMEALAELGFQCRLLSDTPAEVFPPRKVGALRRTKTVVSNATVAAMMAQVRQTNLVAALDELTGNRSVWADGVFDVIRTRHQNSGVPLRRATALAHERLEALGLQTGYQAWTSGSRSNRNVIGEQAGSGASAEILVICAHIDDMPSTGDAPGADDNASGSIAVLTAAEILRNHVFDRTIRYILFTGEEQGMLGSDAYARAAQSAGDDIVAVLNLDMVAWDGNGDGALHLYVRPASDSGHADDRAIAAAFTNVVRLYGLGTDLSPEIVAEVSDWSDHYSFTSLGYPAICAIEEDIDDFNPYYHTAADTVARLNLPYYTRFVQAAVGTVAHLAGPDGRNSPSYFSGDQSIRCTGGAWSRTFAMDLTNFRNLAVQDGYQSYTVNYPLTYDIWTGIYLYDYDAGGFSAVTWLTNLDL